MKGFLSYDRKKIKRQANRDYYFICKDNGAPVKNKNVNFKRKMWLKMGYVTKILLLEKKVKRNLVVVENI